MTVPQNAVGIYAELYASGNAEEEFWVRLSGIENGSKVSDTDSQYFNVPNDYLGDLPADYTYGNGPFREVRMLVDGRVAGVAFP